MIRYLTNIFELIEERAEIPEDSISRKNQSCIKYVVGGLFISVMAGLYWYLYATGALNTVMKQDVLIRYVDDIGFLGPIAIIGFMTGAIVFSPLPSAPIALAAGAVYGHTYGTFYVIIGSLTGAILAFSISRFLGYDILHKWMGKRFSPKLHLGQNTLMGIVFVSRLIPFISFDSVSYIAGLTSLKFWRFAVATLFGIVPASFLLAHFGGEMAADGRLINITMIVLLGGVMILIPSVGAIRKCVKSRKAA